MPESGTRERTSGLDFRILFFFIVAPLSNEARSIGSRGMKAHCVPSQRFPQERLHNAMRPPLELRHPVKRKPKKQQKKKTDENTRKSKSSASGTCVLSCAALICAQIIRPGAIDRRVLIDFRPHCPRRMVRRDAPLFTVVWPLQRRTIY